MKFSNSNGPNPRVVKMFMPEKGLDIPRVEVDPRAGENRQRLGARRARHVDT
jgi:glutathione S-transferase